MFVYPYEHFWFLPAIFLVSVLVVVLDSRQLLANLRGWSVFFGLSLVVYVVVAIPPLQQTW